MKLSRSNWVLIQRYVTGNATSEERHVIEQWMARDPENSKLVRELEKIWELTPEENFDVNAKKAWKKFQSGKKGITQFNRIYNTGYTGSKNIYHIFKAAAFILVAVIAGFFFQYISTIQSEAEQSAERSGFYTMQEMATDRGEKARVTFSDGTRVTLNSSSTVRFPREFQGPGREVYLEGEAYFEVSHDKEYPFIVHTDAANVRVLGTAFNVRGWSEDPGVDITVRSGKVSVSSSEQITEDQSEVILKAGQLTRVVKGEAPQSVQLVDPLNHLLWTSGGMHFDNKPFRQVVSDLERRFSVHITVNNSDLLDVPYTGTFQYAELDEVLSVIAASMKAGYNREDSTIEFN